MLWRREKRDGQPPKVVLAAVARNESAYLAEWIHHHLYFGVDLIDITVNRSDDPSERVLDAICRVEPRLRYRNGDFLDRGKPGSRNIQIEAYKMVRRHYRRRYGRRDYLFFLDIDEFWTPVDFETRIADVLLEAGLPDIALFNWFSLLSDKTLFARTFADPIAGLHVPQIKTAARLGLWPVRISPHSIRTPAPARRWSAAGLRTDWKNRSQTVTAPNDFGPAFVVHRQYRTPLEYLAIVARGNPRRNAARFKVNRVGYRDRDDHSSWQKSFEITPGLRDAYEMSLDGFLARAGLADLLVEARLSVLRKAEDAVATFRDLPDKEQRQLALLFSNLDLDDVDTALAQARAAVMSRAV